MTSQVVCFPGLCAFVGAHISFTLFITPIITPDVGERTSPFDPRNENLDSRLR